MSVAERPIWKIEPFHSGDIDSRMTATRADAEAGNNNGKIGIPEVEGFIAQQRAIVAPFAGNIYEAPQEVRDAHYQVQSAERLKGMLESDPEASFAGAASAKVFGTLKDLGDSFFSWLFKNSI